MRRITIAIASLLVLTFIPLTVAAVTVNGGRNVIVDRGTVVKGSYAAAGGTVDLAGTFEDDVLLAGGTVTVSGSVGGDLLIAGGTVKVTGEVKGSVRVVGGTLDLESRVGRNVTLVGGTLTTGAGADVGGEVVLAGGTVRLSGRVHKSVDGWADTVTVDGSVDGSVTAHLASGNDAQDQGTLTIGSTAVIGGDLVYYAPRDADVRPGSKISGRVEKRAPASVDLQAKAFFSRLLTLGRVWNLFSLLVVAVLVALLLPRTLRNVSEVMVRRVGASVGWGALLFLAAPFALVLLPLTVIGIPLALILFALFLIGLYVSQIFLGYFIGMQLLQRFRRNTGTPAPPLAAIWPTLLGTIVVSLVLDFFLGYLLDQLNIGLSVLMGIVRLFLTLWPFGALVLVKWQLIKEREQ